jgi:tripartite-type tricarboxylate transporter receptor subunit TctC
MDPQVDKLRRALGTAALSFIMLGGRTHAQSPQWPSKPIKIVIPFPPGGSTDSVIRVLAESMTQDLGQPIVIESKPGADGSIAASHVVRSEPDGTTFFVATNTALMQVFLLRKSPPYHPLKDFTPVSMIGRYINILVARPTLPAADAKEFMQLAKSKPGQINYGSYSSTTHLMHSRFKQAGMDMNLVPYKGESATVTDILGGTLDATFATPASALQYIQTGKLRALAVLLPSRIPTLADVPTGTEAGLPVGAAGNWVALVGPAGLPPTVTQQMNRALNAALQKPEVRARIEQIGFQLAGSTAGDTSTFLVEQLRAWSAAYREAGLAPE